MTVRGRLRRILGASGRAMFPPPPRRRCDLIGEAIAKPFGESPGRGAVGRGVAEESLGADSTASFNRRLAPSIAGTVLYATGHWTVDDLWVHLQGTRIFPRFWAHWALAGRVKAPPTP